MANGRERVAVDLAFTPKRREDLELDVLGERLTGRLVRRECHGAGADSAEERQPS